MAEALKLNRNVEPRYPNAAQTSFVVIPRCDIIRNVTTIRSMDNRLIAHV